MKFLAVAAGLVAAVSAYTYPTPFNPTASGAGPSGNAIYTPDTTSPATLGEAYSITWDPTTPGPVALVLCQGPSTNCEPILTIADSIANSGEYTWTPEGLTPSATSSGGYGIMLIDYTTEAYQYSTQFGILAGSSAVSSSPIASAPTSTKTSTSTVLILPSSSVVATPTPSTLVSYVVSTSTYCPESGATTTPAGVVSIPLSTGTISIPWTASPSSPSVPTSVASNAPKPPTYTGAASSNMVSYGAMGAAAGLAALLAF